MNSYDFFIGDNLNPEWVGVKIRNFASKLSEGKEAFRTQLRAFYNEFQGFVILQLTFPKSDSYKVVGVEITYRRTAKASDIPEDMVDFVTQLVNQIGSSEKRFKQACYLMEAFVGFFPRNK